MRLWTSSFPGVLSEFLVNVITQVTDPVSGRSTFRNLSGCKDAAVSFWWWPCLVFPPALPGADTGIPHGRFRLGKTAKSSTSASHNISGMRCFEYQKNISQSYYFTANSTKSSHAILRNVTISYNYKVLRRNTRHKTLTYINTVFFVFLWFRVLQNLLFRMFATDHPFDVFVIEWLANLKTKDTCYNISRQVSWLN